jgi:hypothetical protein
VKRRQKYAFVVKFLGYAIDFPENMLFEPVDKCRHEIGLSP